MVASRVQARIVRYVLPALTKSASKGPESSSPAAQPLQVVAAVSAAVFRRLWNGTRTRSSSAAFQLYTCFLNDLSLRVAVYIGTIIRCSPMFNMCKPCDIAFRKHLECALHVVTVSILVPNVHLSMPVQVTIHSQTISRIRLG